MKITPLEIRQKAFETQFRGFDKDEVDAFLLSLSQEWERVQSTLKEQEVTIASSEKELLKLKQVESSLYKTLQTAETTSSSLIEQASKSAELQIRESQMNAEALINDARILAKDMIDEAEMAIKNSYESMKIQVKQLENDYKSMESYRDNLIQEIKNLTTNLQDKIKRAEETNFKLDTTIDTSATINMKEIMAPMKVAAANIQKTKVVKHNYSAQGSQQEAQGSNTVILNVNDGTNDQQPENAPDQKPGKSFFEQD